MSRYESLMDEQRQQQQSHIEETLDTSLSTLVSNENENELLSSNYLTMVREEPQSIVEHEQQDENKDDDDEDKDENEEKKSKRKSSTDDHKSLSEHHDSDDDDDDNDHKGDRPIVSSDTTQTIQSESSTNQQQTEQSTESQQQQQQSMEMSRDSINELMIMSQDSLKQNLSDSLDSDQELKFLNSDDVQLPSNDADDFILHEHTDEPTPSRMMTKYDDDDDDNNLDSPSKQYPLISNEIEIGQLPVIHARRTASENSLFSTSSSSAPMYESHSLSVSCLADKDDLTPSNDYIDYQQQMLNDETQKNQQIYRETTRQDENEDTLEYPRTSSPVSSSTGFLDRVKAFVSKPVEIVQEAMENRRKQRSTTSLNSNSDINEQVTTHENEPIVSMISSSSSSPQQHFHSAYDLHDDDKLKIIRSPELYNMDDVNTNDQHTLQSNLHIQNRAQSESALVTNDMKHQSLKTTSNEASEEFLPTISKDNSLEFMHHHHVQQQRHSTPYDDVMEKESSPEHSESSNLPAAAFSDTFEPTSSCQRPLALSVPGQQPHSNETMTEEEFHNLAANYVNQVLHDVVVQMTGGEHEDSSQSNRSEQLLDNNATSSDDDEDVLREEDEDEQRQSQIPTDTSSFGINDRYSADESSNTHEHSADEDASARSSLTTTPTKTSRYRPPADIEEVSNELTPTTLAPSASFGQDGSQSDTGTYFSVKSPSTLDHTETHSTYTTADEERLTLQPPTQSNSSQYLTANDETPNALTSDDNEYADESGTINYDHDDSSSDEKHSHQIHSQNSSIITEKTMEEKYSGEGEESGDKDDEVSHRRKRSSEHRLSTSNDSATNTHESNPSKTVSFKLDFNEVHLRSPRSSSSGASNYLRQESTDSPILDVNDKSITKTLQDDILRTNLETFKHDFELNDQPYPLASTPTTTTTTEIVQSTEKPSCNSDYDAGSESDRDSSLAQSLKSTIHVELNDVYNDKESLIDKIKMKFERSLDRLVERTLAGNDQTNKSDIISPFTDQSLNQSLPTTDQRTKIVHSHSEQFLQACPDELDYGTLQRFSSDSCIIIRVPEQYTPSSTLFFDQLKPDQTEQKTTSNQETSAFSYYTKQQQQPQPSSSPIEMLNSVNELIENISPIHRHTPRSLDDSSIELGERDMNDMSDEFVLVKNLSPTTPNKEVKNDTPSNSSTSSSDKHESPDLIDILQHQCDYPPLDTGFDLRAGTTLETVYESPELHQDELKSAVSTLSLTTSELNRPLSAEHNSSNTPNTDDSLMEFERIEMELLKNGSQSNIIEAAREVQSSVDNLIQQHQETDNNNKVESFIEKHFSSFENDVQHVVTDILDTASDLTNSISSQSDATTVISKSQRHSIDDDFVQVTHDDFKADEKHLFSSDDDLLPHQTPLSSQDKRRSSAPSNEPLTRRIKTPSSSSSSSSSFSSTSRSVIYNQQHSSSYLPQQRTLHAETDLTSFKEKKQTQSATDLPFLPPFVSNPMRPAKKQSSSASSTPSVSQNDLSSNSNATNNNNNNNNNTSSKKTHSHPGSLGGSQLPPRSSTLTKEGLSPSQTTSTPHSSSSSLHHSDDCYCADSATTSQQ